MDISLIYNSKDKVSERIILLEFSSYKSFFTPHGKIALERNGLSLDLELLKVNKSENYSSNVTV